MRAKILIEVLSAIYLSEHRPRRCCKELVAACGLASIFLFLANVHLFDGGGTSCRCIDERRPMEEKSRFV